MAVEVVLVLGAGLSLSLHGEVRTEVFVVCLSMALGLQNGAFRRAGGKWLCRVDAVAARNTYTVGTLAERIGRSEKYVYARWRLIQLWTKFCTGKLTVARRELGQLW